MSEKCNLAQMDQWLVERFTLGGITLQNWMVLALAIILIGIIIAWWSRRP